MMDETNNSSSGFNRPQWKCIKKVTGAFEGQLLCISLFTEGDSDPSVEQERKYADFTDLGAEPGFEALVTFVV